MTEETKTEAAPTGPHGGPGEDPAAPPAVPPPLRRDRRYKMLGGVCAGLGRRCDVDPVIFRIVLVVLSVTGGIGLVFYGFAWLLVPAEGEDETEAHRLLTGRVDGSALTALLCALVGLGLFLSMANNSGVLSFAFTLSVVVAGAGYWSMRRRTRAQDPDPGIAQTVADAPPETQAPPVPGSPSWWRDPIVKDGRTGYAWGPDSEEQRRDIAAVRYLSTRPGALPEPAPVASCRSRPSAHHVPRSFSGRVFLAAVVAGFAGTRASWDGGSLGTGLQTGLACALVVLALGIVCSAFLGRLGFGTILLAVVTAGLMTASAALPQDISTRWTERSWAPRTAAGVEPSYDAGTGHGRLDLSGVDVAGGRTLATSVDAAAGGVRVTVPADAIVKVDASVGLGSLSLPGGPDPAGAPDPPESSAPQPGEDDPRTKRIDVDFSTNQRRTATLEPPGGAPAGAGTIELTLHVGIGHLEVDRATS